LVIGAPLVSWIGHMTGTPLPDWTCAMMFPGIGMLIWPLTPRWKCTACGHRWSAPAPEDRDEVLTSDQGRSRDEEQH
jgi:hypothetical protein